MALNKGSLISEQEMKYAYQATKLNSGEYSHYGFGWALTENNNSNIVSHTGGLNGYRAVIWRDLKRKISVIILTNQGDAFPLQKFMKDIIESL